MQKIQFVEVLVELKINSISKHARVYTHILSMSALLDRDCIDLLLQLVYDLKC